jgi:predicted O-methyltransferase YrrM
MKSPREYAIQQKRRLRAIHSALLSPPYTRPGHFYSPSTSREDIQRALDWRSTLPGVDIDVPEQRDLLRTLHPMLSNPHFTRYQADNPQYGLFDASLLQAMIGHASPRRIIEVGSGFSTMAIIDSLDHFELDTQVSCIEPFPERLLSLLDAEDRERIDLESSPVQDFDVEYFAPLQAGDILFLDSTHVAKSGSDVLWEVLHLLPRLSPGVLVHIHDIHWPFEYPREWLLEQRDWNEIYLVHAFLIDNCKWRIRLMSSWASSEAPDLLPQHLRSAASGSLWIQRRNSPVDA